MFFSRFHDKARDKAYDKGFLKGIPFARPHLGAKFHYLPIPITPRLGTSVRALFFDVASQIW